MKRRLNSFANVDLGIVLSERHLLCQSPRESALGGYESSRRSQGKHVKATLVEHAKEVAEQDSVVT